MYCTIIGQKSALQFWILYFISYNKSLKGTARKCDTTCLEGYRPCIYLDNSRIAPRKGRVHFVLQSEHNVHTCVQGYGLINGICHWQKFCRIEFNYMDGEATETPKVAGLRVVIRARAGLWKA